MRTATVKLHENNKTPKNIKAEILFWNKEDNILLVDLKDNRVGVIFDDFTVRRRKVSYNQGFTISGFDRFIEHLNNCKKSLGAASLTEEEALTALDERFYKIPRSFRKAVAKMYTAQNNISSH